MIDVLSILLTNRIAFMQRKQYVTENDNIEVVQNIHL